MLRFLTLAFILAASTSGAQDSLEQRFVDWVESRNMGPAAFYSLTQEGDVFASVAFDADIDTAMAVGSISKTVAGQCLLMLVRRGQVSFAHTVAEYLGWGGPAGRVTLAELLTHSSGYGPDGTQRDLFARLPKNSARMAEVVEEVETRPLVERGAHSYNNENYLVLEAVMSAVLGEPATQWCIRSMRIKTLGVTEDLSAFGLAGGLEMSARDLAGFFSRLSPETDWPEVELSPNNAYGPGIIVQNSEIGTNLFHLGGYCSLIGPNIGAFGVKLANGASVGMVWSGCAGDEDLQLLNAIVLEHLGL